MITIYIFKSIYLGNLIYFVLCQCPNLSWMFNTYKHFIISTNTKNILLHCLYILKNHELDKLYLSVCLKHISIKNSIHFLFTMKKYGIFLLHRTSFFMQFFFIGTYEVKYIENDGEIRFWRTDLFLNL